MNKGLMRLIVKSVSAQDELKHDFDELTDGVFVDGMEIIKLMKKAKQRMLYQSLLIDAAVAINDDYKLN